MERLVFAAVFLISSIVNAKCNWYSATNTREKIKSESEWSPSNLNSKCSCSSETPQDELNSQESRTIGVKILSENRDKDNKVQNVILGGRYTSLGPVSGTAFGVIEISFKTVYSRNKETCDELNKKIYDEFSKKPKEKNSDYK